MEKHIDKFVKYINYKAKINSNNKRVQKNITTSFKKNLYNLPNIEFIFEIESFFINICEDILGDATSNLKIGTSSNISFYINNSHVLYVYISKENEKIYISQYMHFNPNKETNNNNIYIKKLNNLLIQGNIQFDKNVKPPLRTAPADSFSIELNLEQLKKLNSEYIRKETIDKYDYLNKINKLKVDFEKIKKEELKPIKKIKYSKINSIKKITRNPEFTAKALIKADFKCEYNANHITFKSEATNEYYMEGHHLVNLKHQDNHNVSLDNIGNIISLCPTCHACLHRGIKNEKEEILKILFEKKKKDLEQIGINNLTFEKLLEMYL